MGRKSAVDKWQEEHRKKQGYVILKNFSDLIRLLVDPNAIDLDRKQVNPTQLAYIQDTALYKAYMGPAGSGKSVTGCVDIIIRALTLPGSKWFIARRDYNDLKDTTRRTFYQALQQLPPATILDRSKEPPEKLWLKPIDAGADGLHMPSEITFMGLSDELGSYEFNGGFIDEMNEVERRYVDQMKARLRFKPTPDYDGRANTIGGAFNPPAKAHWLYEACTGKNAQDEVVSVPWLKLFRPHPRENANNLPADYYDNMDTMLPEERQRLRDGEWGSIFPGEPVLGKEFSVSLHVRKLKYGGGSLWRFHDFGYNRPCVHLVQKTKSGRIEVIRSRLGYKQEVKQWAAQVEMLTAETCPGLDKGSIVDIGDPAVRQHKDTGSALAQFREAGIHVRYMHTPFDQSLRALRQRFTMLIDREPAILIDPSCVELIDACKGGYRYKPDGITPLKDNFFDHPVDALRYGVYMLFGASGAGLPDANDLPENLAPYALRD